MVQQAPCCPGDGPGVGGPGDGPGVGGPGDGPGDGHVKSAQYLPG